eukprot:scaffold2149_cov187-Cylindrotheca_fusiformis.AAC.21
MLQRRQLMFQEVKVLLPMTGWTPAKNKNKSDQKTQAQEVLFGVLYVSLNNYRASNFVPASSFPTIRALNPR